ncbi:MAG TPA: ATP-binding protein, partial [Longimicrobium sp.]|nr:ATP-binding protein [Longimicrobium sp.]
LASDCQDELDTRYRGDEDRVRQILANLLSNAIKFTPAGGGVTVRCALECEPLSGAWLSGSGPWICIHVEDTGIGIEADQLEPVFQPFVQAEGGHTREHGGTGLGLSISREYARLMGGDLSLRSSPGKGSCFTLWLPTETSATPGRHDVAQPLPGLEPAGKALQAELDRVVAAYRERLRTDPSIPMAEPLSDVEIEDHVATFLADIAQSLLILAETGGEPDLMRDGSDVQRLISERHGAQRCRLGWTEDAVRREFVVLKEEVLTAARDGDGPEVDAALRVLGQLVDRACEISLRGFRLANASHRPEREDLLARTEWTIENTRRTIEMVKSSIPGPGGGA